MKIIKRRLEWSTRETVPLARHARWCFDVTHQKSLVPVCGHGDQIRRSFLPAVENSLNDETIEDINKVIGPKDDTKDSGEEASGDES
ncbi:MAG: hypothetical protein ABIU05_02865 [Nitrospirales bacterium]